MCQPETCRCENELERKKTKLMERLRIDRGWYIKRRNHHQYLWIGLTLSSLVFGLLTSVLVAVGWPGHHEGKKVILIVLPSLSVFCGTLLANFRLRENWELRELGRIDVDELLVRAAFIRSEDPEQFRAALYDLNMARVRLNRQQTSKFFSYFSNATDPKTGTGSGTS